MTNLQKTSIQLDPQTREELKALYPKLTISEITRLALEYVLENKPILVESKSKFGDRRPLSLDPG
jgi:hypothetical protein